MKRHLLLVDADPQSRRILEVSLRKAGHTVTGVGDATAALDRMATALPDLLLTDTRLPGSDGFTLVATMRQRPALGAVPVMFLSSDPSLESKMRGLKQGVEEYLAKPIYIHEVIARVNLVLRRSERLELERRDASQGKFFKGSLRQLGLVDAVQTMEKGRRSGVLHVTADKKRAAFYFRDGALVDAEAGTLRGVQAVEQALSWSEGTFECEFREVRREDAIRAPIQAVLAEGMRRIDDWSRLVDALPPLDHVLEVDAARLEARLDDVPDEANAILRSFDGRRSIQQAIDETGTDAIDRLRMVAQLWSDGLLVDRSDEGVQGAAPRNKRTTADFEAPVSERKKRTTLDYDEPSGASPNEDEDTRATTPGVLDAGELLAPTSPGAVPVPEHAADASGDDDEDAADAGDDAREGPDAASGTALARMRRRRRRWKRLSLEGAPPAPTPTASAEPVANTARPAPAVAAQTAATAETATKTARPVAPAPAAPAPVVATPSRPSSTLLDISQPRNSTAPPPVRSPFSLVPPAADMAARMNAARTRRSLAPTAPQPPPPATPPVVTSITAPLPALMLATASTDALSRAVTRPEDLGRTRIGGSVTTQPALVPPPAGSPPTPAAATAMTHAVAGHAPRDAVAQPVHQVGATATGATLQPAHPLAATAAGAASQPAHQLHAAPATTPAAVAPVTATPTHRADPADRQSAWDILQDEAPITIPPPPSSQRVLVWGAIVGVSLIATALVYRLVASGTVDGSSAAREAPAAAAPVEMEPTQAAGAPAPPTEPVAPAPVAPPTVASPDPAGATAPAPVAPAAEAPAPPEPSAAAAPVPVAPPAAPDPAAQRDLLVQQARALEAKGKTVKALSLYEEAVQLDPNASALLSHLALAYLNAGRYKDALERAQRAVMADPTNSEGWIVLGAARDGRNDHKGAREAYRQCSEVGTGAYVLECRRMLR